MKSSLYLVPVLVITVFILIRARFNNNQQQIYFFKPLSTLIVICAALLSFLEPTQNLLYTFGILLGLLFSIGGDIALMFDGKKSFITGLSLFFTAHIIYTIVFMLLGRFSLWDTLPAIILLTTGISFYVLIRSRLEATKLPVIGYIAIISIMVSRAFSTSSSPSFNNEQALMIIAGALLFYISDMILAANKFWKPWKYNHLSLIFYYSGQFFIALAASYF
ncbi:MAG: lysoplasmalogenase [Spirochaetota bacterium]